MLRFHSCYRILVESSLKDFSGYVLEGHCMGVCSILIYTLVTCELYSPYSETHIAQSTAGRCTATSLAREKTTQLHLGKLIRNSYHINQSSLTLDPPRCVQASKRRRSFGNIVRIGPYGTFCPWEVCKGLSKCSYGGRTVDKVLETLCRTLFLGFSSCAAKRIA